MTHYPVIYTTPTCPACDATKRAFTRAGITFETVNLADLPDLAAEFRALGRTQAPVVVTGPDPQDIWSGFRPDRINQYINHIKENAA